jgi:hypothetical protein
VIISHRRILCIFFYVGALAAAAFAYHYSWQAGCLFDGKSGIGSMEGADPYLTDSWWAVSVGLLLLASAAPLGFARSRVSAAGSAVVGLLVGAPLLFTVMWVAESAGVRACVP